MAAIEEVQQTRDCLGKKAACLLNVSRVVRTYPREALSANLLDHLPVVVY